MSPATTGASNIGRTCSAQQYMHSFSSLPLLKVSTPLHALVSQWNPAHLKMNSAVVFENVDYCGNLGKLCKNGGAEKTRIIHHFRLK